MERCRFTFTVPNLLTFLSPLYGIARIGGNSYIVIECALWSSRVGNLSLSQTTLRLWVVWRNLMDVLFFDYSGRDLHERKRVWRLLFETGVADGNFWNGLGKTVSYSGCLQTDYLKAVFQFLYVYWNSYLCFIIRYSCHDLGKLGLWMVELGGPLGKARISNAWLNCYVMQWVS